MKLKLFKVILLILPLKFQLVIT